MKLLVWFGLAMLALGILALVVPVPRTGGASFAVDGASVSVETQRRETFSPIIGAVMILSGAGLMIAGKAKAA